MKHRCFKIFYCDLRVAHVCIQTLSYFFFLLQYVEAAALTFRNQIVNCCSNFHGIDLPKGIESFRSKSKKLFRSKPEIYSIDSFYPEILGSEITPSVLGTKRPSNEMTLNLPKSTVKLLIIWELQYSVEG